MTPLEAIHRFCVVCVGSPFGIRDCGGDKCLNGGCDKNGFCWFYPYRIGNGRPSVKLIRRYCVYCQGDRTDFVKECFGKDCPLHDYRMGTNPKRAGIAGNFAKTDAVSRGFAA